MEQLLSDLSPDQDAVFADLAADLAQGLITPVFFGSALNGFGVRRLLKALRHETPDVVAAALACPEVVPHVAGKAIKKRIFIPKRMVNLVAG